jgi:hypothetical protein
MVSNHHKKAMNRSKKILIPLGTLLLLLIALRLALPGIVLKYVNKKLENLKDYTGNIQDIDIRLYRGAYIVRDITIDKRDEDGKEDTIPFFTSHNIDLSIDWNSLFKGKITGKIKLNQPVLNYTSELQADKEFEQDTADFQELLKSLMPLTVNRFEINNGQIHYIDIHTKPLIDLAMKDLNVVATNLTNVVNKEELLPAQVTGSATLYGGSFTLDLRLNPLIKQPTFELSTELINMDLAAANDFFRTYGNLEVQQGKFSVYAEFAGKEGNFGGYVKPFITDFKINRWNEKDDLKQRIWEMFVGTAMNILENPKTDKVATKIPINGTFNDPDIKSWKAIQYVLRNAFVQALRPMIENTISVHKLEEKSKKTLLEKVFGEGDDK